MDTNARYRTRAPKGLFFYESHEDSDVDLLVEPSNQRFSIFDLVRVRDFCRTILGTTPDIHDYDGLRRLPEFRRRVGGDLIRVF